MNIKTMLDKPESFSVQANNVDVLNQTIIKMMLQAFKLNPKRSFVFVCSKKRQDALMAILRLSGEVDKAITSTGMVYLKGREELHRPVVIFRQAGPGNEEAIAGFCFHHLRMFVDGDYISQKGLRVAWASITELDNAMTVFSLARMRHSLTVTPIQNINMSITI